MTNYFNILGVPETASIVEIKLAYRNLAKQYHPDINNHPEAQRKFLEINDAYIFLSNPDKRRLLRKSNARQYQNDQKQEIYNLWVEKQKQQAKERAVNQASDEYHKFTQSRIYKAAMWLGNFSNYFFIFIGMLMIIVPVVVWKKDLTSSMRTVNHPITYILPMIIGIIFTFGIYYFQFVIKVDKDNT